MLLTPRIIRSQALTEADLMPINIGTAQNPTVGGPPPLLWQPPPEAPPAAGGRRRAGCGCRPWSRADADTWRQADCAGRHPGRAGRRLAAPGNRPRAAYAAAAGASHGGDASGTATHCRDTARAAPGPAARAGSGAAGPAPRPAAACSGRRHRCSRPARQHSQPAAGAPRRHLPRRPPLSSRRPPRTSSRCRAPSSGSALVPTRFRS